LTKSFEVEFNVTEFLDNVRSIEREFVEDRLLDRVDEFSDFTSEGESHMEKVASTGFKGGQNVVVGFL